MTHELMKISQQGLLQTEPTIHTKTQTLIPNNTLRNVFFVHRSGKKDSSTESKQCWEPTESNVIAVRTKILFIYKPPQTHISMPS